MNANFVISIEGHRMAGMAGFVYETGMGDLGHGRNHIHLPSDLRPLHAPDYSHWFWINLGGFYL